MRANIRLAAGDPRHPHFHHDSIGVGPTHQPIEQLPSAGRAWIDHYAPADNEVTEAWRVIAKLRHERSCWSVRQLCLRPNENAPAWDSRAGMSGRANGQPDVLLLATGSEVSLCVQAYEMLKAEGVKARVFSLPSWELFERQSQEYRDSVLPRSILARVCVEQASTFGWERYVGRLGHAIGMRTFGASAPLKELLKKFGFTAENVVAAAKHQIGMGK